MKNNTKRAQILRFAILSAAVLAAILLVNGLFIQNLKNSSVNLINVAMIYYFSVAGMYIMLGLGGCMAMCSIAVMGLSAFVCGFTNTKLGWPLLPAMLAGVLSAAVLCLAVGSLLLKLDGRAFMFGTMALVYIGTSIFQNFSQFTGGPNGTAGISKLTLFGKTFSSFKSWFVPLAILCYILILLLHRIKSTSFGRSLMACRDDETAAYSLGVNVYRTKLIAFVISGALSGIGGALYAVHNGAISASLFAFSTQQSFIIMLMLGGVMSPVGALFGSVLVNYLPEIARSAGSYLNMIYGILIILLMIFMPMGLAGLIKDAITRMKAQKKKKAIPAAKEGN